MRIWTTRVCSNMFEEKIWKDIIMTIGEKIKQLRSEKGLSQEKLAEKLNVSRSAIAKWETDGGIPEIDNLLQLSIVFGVSLDELVRNTKGQNNSKEADKYSENHDFGNQCYDIELAGWNDGVYGVYILTEDKDFLYYRYSDKANTIYGMIGRKYITAVSPIMGDKMDENYVKEISRDSFCDKPVKIELAKREGLIRGFLDFRDDDYRNVVISSFEADILRLQFGGKLNLGDITKIEEFGD